ncbi:MAG: hypothetical protein AB7R89_03410 [Dehalococcoidia bacterium]
MKGTSIFSGKKLSEQTPVATSGIDQRLFAPAPSPQSQPSAPTAAAAHPNRPESPTATPEIAEMNEATRPVPIPLPSAAAPAAVQDPPPRFELDLTAIPHRKDSFLFTTEEFEALEDLKLQVGRGLDIKVTKQNLMRCALAALIDDWRRKGPNSSIIAPLRRRGR